MSTFTANPVGIQRGQPRQPQAPPPRVSAVVTDCGQCGHPTAVPVNAPGPHRCQRCRDRQGCPQVPDDSRADRLFIASCRLMSESDLRELIASMGRQSGGIYHWIQEQAAGILCERFGVTPEEADAGFIDELRQGMVERGHPEFANAPTADEDEIARVESGDLDPYDQRNYNDV